MKIIFYSITFCAAFMLLTTSACLSDAVQTETIKPSVDTTPSVSKSPSENKAKPAMIRVRIMKKVDFAGVVTDIDHATQTITLRRGGKTISFDTANPSLLGYTDIKDIRKGDTVSVGYTRTGIVVRKGSLPPTQDSSTLAASPSKVSSVKRKKNGPQRVARKTDPTCFADADNNKDGKISPVELSVALPGLTMEKFKSYDKNGDGCLNEEEFKAVRK